MHLFQSNCILAPTNLSFAWASIVIEVLHKLGLEYVISCPGSRSAPLSLVCAKHPHIKTIPILDERSAAFFALGIAKRIKKPVLLICSSGTAGANFYPACIEAYTTSVPLFIITADRPSQDRYCNSRQTINQLDLFGRYTQFHAQVAHPNKDLGSFEYLRQIITQAYEKALIPSPGPVHLNMPFSEPLDPKQGIGFKSFFNTINWKKFFSNIRTKKLRPQYIETDCSHIFSKKKGIILVGYQEDEQEDFAKNINYLSEKLAWPILASPLSSIYHQKDKIKYLINHYDSILNNTENLKLLEPELILRIGFLPLSKHLENYIALLKKPSYIIDPYFKNLDFLHQATEYLRIDLATLNSSILNDQKKTDTNYALSWTRINESIKKKIGNLINQTEQFCSVPIAYFLSEWLPKSTSIFSSVSQTIRDIECFWKASNNNYHFYCNRGVNGIDGITSTALGIAYLGSHSLLITGDLAFLYDTNALLSHSVFKGSLTILILNNEGGGIFDRLALAQSAPKQEFEEYIITKQNIAIGTLAKAYKIPYFNPKSWIELKLLLQNLNQTGIRIIELNINRQYDQTFRTNILNQLNKYELGNS